MAGTDIDRIIVRARDRFELDHDGIHGIKHWRRVKENGLKLAEKTGADALVVELFAYLHDCCRESDGYDDGHGVRAAEFAGTLRGEELLITDSQFELLTEACRLHTCGKTKGDITVMTCWDADRLDLPRVGTIPRAELLCTEHAKERSVIEWAMRRAWGHM